MESFFATHPGVTLACVGAVIVGFLVVLGLLGHWSDKAGARRRFKEIPHTTTVAQERTRIAMEEAIRNTQQNPPSAAPPATLSARLSQLDDALKAGQISQQEYAAARAAILASP